MCNSEGGKGMLQEADARIAEGKQRWESTVGKSEGERWMSGRSPIHSDRPSKKHSLSKMEVCDDRPTS